MNRQQSKDTQKMLEAIREDIRRMGPDGTIDVSKMGLGEYLKMMFPEPGDFIVCPPKYLDVLNRRWTEMLG